MSGLVNGALRPAAAVLLLLSLLLLVVGVISAVQTFGAMRAAMIGGTPGIGGPGIGVLLYSVLTSVSLAAIPYFGAAILWRMDRTAVRPAVGVTE